MIHERQAARACVRIREVTLEAPRASWSWGRSLAAPRRDPRSRGPRSVIQRAMLEVLVACFGLILSLADLPAGEALISTAKDTRLTVETATQHVAAARFAAALTGTDADLLLAIAHHESRYELEVVGPWVRGKRACGVLQQVPIEGTCPPPSLVRDYLHGAQHLATWIRAQHGDVERALIGYAGGYALLALCDRGEAPRACSIGRVHQARARRIKRARDRVEQNCAACSAHRGRLRGTVVAYPWAVWCGVFGTSWSA